MAITKEDIAKLMFDDCWFPTIEEASAAVDELLATAPDAKRFVWFFETSIAADKGDAIANAMVSELLDRADPTTIDEFRAIIDDVSSRHAIEE